MNDYNITLVLSKANALALLQDLHIAECEGYGCNANAEIVGQLEEQDLER